MPRILPNPHEQQQFGWLNKLPEVSLDELRKLLALHAQFAPGAAVPTAGTAVLADQPVRVGGIRLWRPTIGAQEFLAAGALWFGGEPEMRLLLDAWTLAHARQPARLAQAHCEAAARRILGTWRARLGVTWQELEAAVDAALEGFPVSGPLDPSAMTPGALAYCASMMERFGGELDYWLWCTSSQRAYWIGRELADAEAEKPTDRPSVWHAMQAFRRLRREIRERRMPADTPEDAG